MLTQQRSSMQIVISYSGKLNQYKKTISEESKLVLGLGVNSYNFYSTLILLFICYWEELPQLFFILINAVHVLKKYLCLKLQRYQT